MKIQLIKSKFNHGMNNDRIFHIDNFWDDCIKEEQKLNNPLFKISQEEYSQAYISNNNSINCSSPNFSEGLNNSLCLNKSLNDLFIKNEFLYIIKNYAIKFQI